MSKKNKKHLTCPYCECQDLDIFEKYEYSHSFTIKDGKMFGRRDELGLPTGVVWISCSDCRQTGNSVEWKASIVEKRLITFMMDKATDAIDISEFLDGSY